MPDGKSQSVIAVHNALVPLEMVEDIADFYQIEQTEVVRRLSELDPAAMARAWDASPPSNAAEVRAFYGASDHYIWETTTWNFSPDYGAQWKALEEVRNMFPPDRYPRVLDYGCGVGSAAFHMANHGYQVSVADVPGMTLKFVRHRADRRQTGLGFIEIAQDVPVFAPNSYDIVLCLDVLEHVPDPEKVLASLVHGLRTGGAAVLRVTFARDTLLPFHLAGNWDRFGQTNNWWIYVNSLGLDGVGADLVYRRIAGFRLLARRLRFWLWRLTGIFVMRVPR